MPERTRTTPLLCPHCGSVVLLLGAEAVLPGSARPSAAGKGPERTWLNVEEAAEETGFSIHSIRDAASAGELVGYRRPGSQTRGHWRFKLEDLQAWLQKGPRGR